jgi:hypothetical protein
MNRFVALKVHAEIAAQLAAALDSLPTFRAGMLEMIALIPLKPYPGFGPAK